MSKKSKVLKAFLILAAAIAICMYFSRTIQTITTPKVKLVTADVGRIEQKISVALTPYFPVKTEITLTKAKDYPITVDKVYVKTGLYVEKGDTILTAVINDYDKKEKELTDSYAKKAQELIELDITNRKNSKQSMQNDLYDDMLAKQDALSDAESKARLAAAKEGLELSYDQSTWLAKAQSAKASDEVTALINAAVTAKQNFDQARQDFFDSYENKQIKVADDVFKYIKSRNALVKELQQLSDDMVALQEAQQSLSVVTASSAGYVVGLDLKSGDVYSGDKVLYTIAKEGDKPVLRADVTDLKKDVSEGAKVEVHQYTHAEHHHHQRPAVFLRHRQLGRPLARTPHVDGRVTDAEPPDLLLVAVEPAAAEVADRHGEQGDEAASAAQHAVGHDVSCGDA